jgi:hypothetical protein
MLVDPAPFTEGIWDFRPAEDNIAWLERVGNAFRVFKGERSLDDFTRVQLLDLLDFHEQAEPRPGSEEFDDATLVRRENTNGWSIRDHPLFCISCDVLGVASTPRIIVFRTADHPRPVGSRDLQSR